MVYPSGTAGTDFLIGGASLLKEEKAPPVEKITVKELFEKFEQEPPQDMKPCLRLFQIFKELFSIKFITSVPFWIIATCQDPSDRWILVGRFKIPRAYFNKINLI